LKLLLAAFLFFSGEAAALVETPMLKDDVAAGKLPPVEKRLPQNPRVMVLEAGKVQGHHGGTLQSLAGRSRDTRLFTIYGYARMVVYTPELKIVPDLVESFEPSRAAVSLSMRATAG
jgi:peptide/nickel transport system substrate-binding protein